MKLFGWLGMLLVQFSTLFQLFHFYQNKKTDGVSIGFWWTVYIGLMCYLAYSISIMDWVYITSNCVGIILSSISIIMYYYYRKGEEYGNCDFGMGLAGVPSASGVGFVKRPTQSGGGSERVRAVLHQVPLCGSGSNDYRSRATGQNLREVPKVSYLNICLTCHRFWVNNQGYPRYINLEEAGEMLTDKATKRFKYCPSCKGG